MLNERQRKLLSYIKQLERPCSLEELSSYFKMSERTIRNDIKVLKLWGESRQIPIHFKNSMLQIEVAALPLLKQRLNEVTNFEEISNSPLTRQLYITLTLLMSDEHLSLNQLADLNNSSKSTISTDMKSVNEWLKKLQLTLKSSNHGYFIEADEVKRRLSLMNVLEWLEFSYQAATPYKYVSWSNLSHKDVQSFDEQYKEFVSFSNVVNVPLYATLLIQFERIKNGSILSLETLAPYYKKIPSNAEHHTYISEIEKFFRLLNVKLEEPEKHFLECVLYLYQMNGSSEQNISEHYVGMLYQLTEHLGIGEISEETSSLLLNELIRISKWNQLNVSRNCPLYYTAYEKFKVIFRIVEQCQQQFEALQSVPQHMWTEIVLLLAGELELQEQTSNKINAILVCPNGSATSFFIEKKIQRYFPMIQIVAQMSVEQVVSIKDNLDIDLILSTVILPDMNERVVIIPPLADEKQLEVVQQFVRKVEQRKLHTSTSIDDIFDEQCVVFKEHIGSIEHLLQEGVSILQNNGFVNKRVQQELFTTYEKFGLYFEIMPGLIMPHIISSGVSRVGLSCIRLAQPLKIFDKEIYTSITLVSPNEKDHIYRLKRLYELLSKANTVHEFNLLIEKRLLQDES